MQAPPLANGCRISARGRAMGDTMLELTVLNEVTKPLPLGGSLPKGGDLLLEEVPLGPRPLP